AVIRERFVEDPGAVLVVRADGVGIPELVVDPSTLTAAGPHERQCPGPRHTPRLSRRHRHGRQGGRADRHGPDLDEPSPAKSRTRWSFLHGVLLLRSCLPAGGHSLRCGYRWLWGPNFAVGCHGASQPVKDRDGTAQARTRCSITWATADRPWLTFRQPMP